MKKFSFIFIFSAMSLMALCNLLSDMANIEYDQRLLTPPPAPLTFYTGFEDADRTNGGLLNVSSPGLSCQPDGMQVVTTQALRGLYSIRSIVRSNDVPKCGGSYRDEWLIRKLNADSLVKDRFISFGFFPEDYYPGGLVDVRDELIFQTKVEGQQIFPHVAIWIRPDASGLFSKYQLVVKYGTAINTPDASSITKTYDFGRVYSDKWVHFALDIDWQYNSTGSVKVYMDGKLVDKGGGFTAQGQNMNPPYNTSAVCYPTIRGGIYKFPWSNNTGPFAINQRVAYYDEIKVGHTGTIADYLMPANVPPSASAGPNRFLSLPTNSTTLNGTGSTDMDGSIATWAWTKLSGPTTYTLSNANTSIASLTNLVPGTYKFQLKVTDNLGAADSSTVNVDVAAVVPPNIPPLANAGANASVNLPTSSIALSGSGTDVDGTITGYAWTQDSGPGTAVFSNAAIAGPTVSNLKAGRYIFRLTVTDNNGATNAATVEINVIAAVDNSRKVKLKVRHN